MIGKAAVFCGVCILGVLCAPFYFIGLIVVGPVIYGARRFLSSPGLPDREVRP